jgi:flap endonuclease-1
MGIYNFYIEYANLIKPIDINNFNKKTLVIDFVYQLYRTIIGIKGRKRPGTILEALRYHSYIDINQLKNITVECLYNHEDAISHIIATCSFVEFMIDKEINPIIVFDGKPPDLKKRTLDARRQIKIESLEICNNIADKQSNNYLKNIKKTVRLTKQHYSESIELLEAMGLIVVLAPSEADPQCAAIALYYPDIAGIMAEDSDILVFGGQRLVKNFSRKNKIVNQVNLTDILEHLKVKANSILNANNLKEIMEITRLNLIDFSILQGTDYNTGINIKHDILFELFVLNNFDIAQVLEDKDKLLENKIPTDLTDNWKKVQSYYLNADIIDPVNIQRIITQPNLVKLTKLLQHTYKFNKKFVKKIYDGLLYLQHIHTPPKNAVSMKKKI